MDFFGMGTGEILLIIVIALLIWGPNRIVEIARTLGKMVHSLRNMTTDLTTAVTREIDLAEKGHLPPPKADNDLARESSDTARPEPPVPGTTGPSH